MSAWADAIEPSPGTAFEPCHRGGRGIGVDVRDEDVGAGFATTRCDAETDTHRRTSDDDGLAGQVERTPAHAYPP